MTNDCSPKCIMIISGETSGDSHGAKLVEAMRARGRNLFFCGIGGPQLKAAGVRVMVDAAALSVVGFTEALAKLKVLAGGVMAAKRMLRALRPDLLILIDFPDFNLHVAATAKKLGVPVLYYVSPQIWAWRSGRIHKIAARVDHMAVILPFEQAFYRQHGIAATFVGHPLLDNDSPVLQPTMESTDLTAPVIGLLPGSREREIAHHLPVMLAAARRIALRLPAARFLVSLAPGAPEAFMARNIRLHGHDINVETLAENIEQVFHRCTLVVAASGTVTLEAAMAGVPMVIVYKLSPLSYWLGRALIRVKYIGLVNLIADREIVPELLQAKASPDNIADTVHRMLTDPAGLKDLQTEFARLRENLGGAGASRRVAEIALGML